MRISDWSSDVCSSELVGACDLLQAGLAAGRGRVPWGHPTGRRGAGGVDGALFWRQLLSDAVAAERAADGAFQPGDRGAAHHAALSAQSPFPIQHAELHLHTGAAEADRPGQRHAVPPRLVPKIYAGWRRSEENTSE